MYHASHYEGEEVSESGLPQPVRMMAIDYWTRSRATAVLS